MILELNQPQYLIFSSNTLRNEKNYRFIHQLIRSAFRFRKRMDYEKMVMRISYK